MSHPISVAHYLFERLGEVGVKHLFGVPGDYNLWLLEELFQNSPIEWSSNANELNAAYAADGYARVNGIAALVTTFGVGELSALNGISGSAAEHVPVLHIVGAPPLAEQDKKSLMHHTFGDGDFNRFQRIYSQVSVAHALLTPENAVAEIDRVLTAVLRNKQPGYLIVPMDVVKQHVTRPQLSLAWSAPCSTEKALYELKQCLLDRFRKPQDVTVLAGHLAERFGYKEQVRALVSKHNFPSASVLMGKGVLDETYTNHIGLYVGGASCPFIQDYVENSDVIVAVGVTFSDAVTGGFTDNLNHANIVDIQPFFTTVGSQRFDVEMRDALAIIDLHFSALDKHRMVELPAMVVTEQGETVEALSQKNIWKLIEGILQDGDIIVADLGTTFFGAASIRLPAKARMLAQPLWGSIGYSIPAAYGAQKATPSSRVILIVGDGSALLTAQEVGTILRDDLPMIMIVINNDGYTIERLICNPERAYHDVPSWDWKLLPALMSKGSDYVTKTVTHTDELLSAFREHSQCGRFALVEAILPKLDAPELMAAITNSITNK